jgi:SecD/SecF fusion protein
MKWIVLFLAVVGASVGATARAEKLVYEIEPSSGTASEVNIENVVRAVHRRVNPGLFPRGKVRAIDETRIEVEVFRDNPARVQSLTRVIESLGTLEFRILANDQDHKPIIESANNSQANVLKDSRGNLLAWWVPVAKGKEESFDSYPEIAKRRKERGGTKTLEILVVWDRFNVNGSYLSRVTAGDNDGPCVYFTFNTRGAVLFRGLTGDNLPDERTGFTRKLGIIIDGYLHSAPAIRSTISQHGQITGDFTKQEVNELVTVLNAGSLPVRLRRIELNAAPAKPKED